MSEPFLAEIRIVAFNFAPRGWSFCDGQILPINQNQSLYSLLGTTYGGDGRTTFALPDLRGRTPIHFDSQHQQGQRSGEETHTLSANEMPQHKHILNGDSNAATTNTPSNTTYLASVANGYAPAQNLVAMASAAVTHVGGGQAHDNMMPYLTLNFCIALRGLFPSRN